MTRFDTTAHPVSAQPANPKSVRFETLDSWRGICALLVAMMHFPAAGPLSESPLVRNAYLFVDYFFVLSGFVIAHGYGRKLGGGLQYLRFVVLRLGRIYPLHVAVLAAFVAFEALRWAVPALRGDGAAPFSQGNTLPELARSLALLNGMGVESNLTWNGPSWSISAEVWTYLLFGLVVMALGRRHWLALVAAVLAGPAILYAWSPHFMDATWDFGFVRCVYGFSLGALLYRMAGPGLAAARAGAGGSRLVWTVAELIAIATVAGFVAVAGHGGVGIAAPFVFAWALVIFAREGGLASRMLKSRAFLWLGALSYGIYMVHIFVQSRMINAATLAEKLTGLDLVGDFAIRGERFYGFGMDGEAFGTLMMGLMIVLVLATALVAHFLVEKPFQRLSRRIADRLPGPRGHSEPASAPVASHWVLAPAPGRLRAGG